VIYEVRTYTLKVGSVSEFEKRFGEALPARQEFSPCAALLHSEIGPLNQVIHIWPYESQAERERLRAEAAKAGVWPPKVGEFVLDQQVEIMLPAPFMKPLGSRDFGSGNIYEMRSYNYQVGAMPKVLDLWGQVIAQREEHSPLVACWYSDAGQLNKFVHTWVYKDFAERDRVRQEIFKGSYWPPKTGEWLLRQENKILAGAAFSALR